MRKIGRNEPCYCESGKKYKNCCIINNTIETNNIVDFNWQKLRTIDDTVSEKLFSYTVKHFLDLFPFAWEEFYCFKEDISEMNPEELIFSTAFLPWLFYNWVPDDCNDLIDTELNCTIAESYLLRYGYTLTNHEKEFIQENLLCHYSYYEVLSVIPEQSIRVKDLLRNCEVNIHEQMGSIDLKVGSVFLGRVISINGCSIFVGNYPYVLPASFIINAILLKQHYCKDNFTDYQLHEYDIEIRELFFDTIYRLHEREIPQLKNTDDDEIVMTEVIYELNCSTDQAFHKLAVLNIIDTKEELLEDALYDEDGQLREVRFAWLVKGNKIHEAWDNTVFAQITITETQLIVEVNSIERAEKVKSRISKLMSNDVRYKDTIIKELDFTQSSNNQQAYEDYNELNIDIQAEIQKIMKDMYEQQWIDWLDMKIPALRNQTPRTASKTKKGRELLEALLTDFHQQNLKIKDSDDLQLSINLTFLRKSLNME